MVWIVRYALWLFARTVLPLRYRIHCEGFDKLRRLVEAEGRDPASVGLEVWTSTGSGTEKDWREEISFWKQAGVTHVTLHNTFGGYHHKRMAGRSMTDHVNAMRRYRNAVADLL